MTDEQEDGENVEAKESQRKFVYTATTLRLMEQIAVAIS